MWPSPLGEGWPWGKAELDQADFKILTVTGITRKMAEVISMQEVDKDGEVVRARRYAFDIADAGTTKDGRKKVVKDKKTDAMVSVEDAENDHGEDEK